MADFEIERYPASSELAAGGHARRDPFAAGRAQLRQPGGESGLHGRRTGQRAPKLRPRPDDRRAARHAGGAGPRRGGQSPRADGELTDVEARNQAAPPAYAPGGRRRLSRRRRRAAAPHRRSAHRRAGGPTQRRQVHRVQHAHRLEPARGQLARQDGGTKDRHPPARWRHPRPGRLARHLQPDRQLRGGTHRPGLPDPRKAGPGDRGRERGGAGTQPLSHRRAAGAGPAAGGRPEHERRGRAARHPRGAARPLSRARPPGDQPGGVEKRRGA